MSERRLKTFVRGLYNDFSDLEETASMQDVDADLSDLDISHVAQLHVSASARIVQAWSTRLVECSWLRSPAGYVAASFLLAHAPLNDWYRLATTMSSLRCAARSLRGPHCLDHAIAGSRGSSRLLYVLVPASLDARCRSFESQCQDLDRGCLS